MAFTTRRGGYSSPPFNTLNLAPTSYSDPREVTANLGLVRAALGLRGLAGVHQVHGTRVVRIPDGFGVNGALARADAMVTTARGLGLMVKTGDCLPVLFADATAGVIGTAHAGRVGLLAGVLPAAVAALRAAGAKDLTAWIGPHVCPLCYEVPQDMAEAAWEQLPATRAESRLGTPAIDLGAGAAAQLAGLGVETHLVGNCTVEDPDLFSYRRDGARSGRQAGIVWLV